MTLFFLPRTGSAPITFAPSGTDWNHINSNNRPLLLEPNSDTVSTVSYAPDAVDDLNNYNAMASQFISQVFPPQVFTAGTCTIGAGCYESNSLNNLFLAHKLYAVDAAGGGIINTLVAVTRQGSEMGTSMLGRCWRQSISAWTASVPWRLILELGAGGTPTTGGGRHNFTLYLGCNWGTTANVYLISAGETNTPLIPLLIVQPNKKHLLAYPVPAHKEACDDQQNSELKQLSDQVFPG